MGDRKTYELRGLHHIALDLELTAHEHLLRIALALDQLCEVGIAEL